MKSSSEIWILIVIIAGFFIASFWITSVLIRYFQRKKLYDVPNERKLHAAPIPSSGGLVFGMCALLSMFILKNESYLLLYILAALILMTVGYFDDRLDLSARFKFGFQFGVAILTVFFMGDVVLLSEDLGILNEIIAVVFIVGFINAFNLIDGVDGLAGSFAILVLAGLSFYFWSIDRYELMLFSTILATAVLGFLHFNFYNARIYMGDTGSLFLGYSISFLTLIAIQSNVQNQFFGMTTNHIKLFMVALLFLPIIDTLRVMISRYLRGKRIFNADRSHLHHLLLKIGFSPRQIVLFFIGATVIFVLEVSVCNTLNIKPIWVLILLVITAVFGFNAIVLLRIKQHEKRLFVFQHELQLVMRKNSLIERDSLQFTQGS